MKEKVLKLDLKMSAYEKALFNTYVAGIDPIELSDVSIKKEKHELANEKEQTEFHALCEQLNGVASQSRPDVAFDVYELNTKFDKVTDDEIHKANKVVKRLKYEQISLKYSLKGDLKEAKLLTFCDASFANLPYCGSHGGIIVFLGDGMEMYSHFHGLPDDWREW